MAGDSVRWFLGDRPERWVPDAIDVIGQYQVLFSLEDEPRVRLVVLGAIAAVLALPALFFRQIGVVVGVVVMWLLWRGWRRLRREPNDMIVAAASGRLWLLRGTSTALRGWTIRGVEASWKIDSLASLTIDASFELEITGPDGKHFHLRPGNMTRGAQMASTIARYRGEGRQLQPAESVRPEHRQPQAEAHTAERRPAVEVSLPDCQYVTGATIEQGVMVRPPGTIVTLMLNGWGLVAFVDNSTFFRAPATDMAGVTIGGLEEPGHAHRRFREERWATIGIVLRDERHVVFKVPNILAPELRATVTSVTHAWLSQRNHN